MIKLHEKALDFTLKGSDKNNHSLSDYLGKNVILYFYPKDHTPGCTLEAEKFRDEYDTYENLVRIGAIPYYYHRNRKYYEPDAFPGEYAPEPPRRWR